MAEMMRVRDAFRSVNCTSLAERCDVRDRILVAVCDAAGGLFWTKNLDIPLPSRFHWGREVLIEPLVAALDEYECVGIMLLGRGDFRVLTMFLGQVREEIHETFQRKVGHTKTVGMGKLGASSHAQQKVYEQIRLNLRQMIKRLESMVTQHGITGLSLAVCQ